MSPEARSAGALVVASNIETFLQELIGKDYGLKKSINVTTNFEVNPAVVDAVGEVVFCNEFFRMSVRRTRTYYQEECRDRSC